MWHTATKLLEPLWEQYERGIKMFNDYEEYLREPSEVDGIIEEMKDKLHSLITDEAKDVMNEYRKAKKEIGELDLDISRKRGRINDLNRMIEELEEKYEYIDKYKMPRKYIDSFVREYTGYFAPGDKVFIIDSTTKRIQCDKCNGEKNIKATIDGEVNTIECIKCKGYGTVGKTVRTIRETTIDRVYLKLGFKEDRVSLWTSDSVYVMGVEYAVDPKDIFKTYEEAEKSMKKIK